MHWRNTVRFFCLFVCLGFFCLFVCLGFFCVNVSELQLILSSVKSLFCLVLQLSANKQVQKRTLFFSLFLLILVSDHSKNIQNTRHILLQLEYFPLANHALLRHQCFFLQRLAFLVFEFILLLTFFPFSCSLFLNSNSSGLLHSVIHHQ